MKIGPISRVIGVVTLACLVIVAIRYLETIPSDRFIALLGFQNGPATTGTPSPSATPSPAPTQLQDVSGLFLGTVAVQTFNGSALVRSGSGAIVSSDGLIVTVAGVAPFGSGSYVYQVAASNGAVYRAKAVYRADGLVILRVESSDLNPILFEPAQISAGDEARAIGAFVLLSRYSPLILTADVAYVPQSGQAALSMDKTYLSMAAGSRVVDSRGRTVGLVQLGNFPRLIPAKTVNAVIDDYLNQKK